jgi:nitric oxide reductase NorQ protein
VSVKQACRSAICLPLTDDEGLQETLNDLIEDIF